MKLFPRALAVILLLFAPLATLSAELPLIYWENPEVFIDGQARFPQTASGAGLEVLAWQESRERGENVEVSISMAVRQEGGAWEYRRRAAGPWVYAGAEPSMFSLAVDGSGRILIAVAAATARTELHVSSNAGRSFERVLFDTGADSSLSPRISIASDGSYLLFITRGTGESLSFQWAHSSDAKNWTSFTPFVPDSGMRLNLLPTHAAFKGRDYVVYQSISQALRPTFQLWCQVSGDGGRSWQAPQLLTSFDDPEERTRPESEFWDNQRPALSALGEELWLAWERRLGNGSPQVYAGRLELSRPSQDPEGSVSLPLDLAIVEASRVSPRGAYANNPLAFSLDGEPTLIWFDDRSAQTRVYMAQRDVLGWQDVALSGARSNASFARPLPSKDGLVVFWQSPLNGVDRLYVLAPDRSVRQPTLRPLNFVDGQRSRREAVRVAWNRLEDASGIEGWSWSWSQDPEDVPPEVVQLLSEESSRDLVANADGTWYFSLRARDWAGNWSRPSRVRFVRDTTAPGKPRIRPAALDDEGYLLSNTFSLDWDAPADEDVASYSWALQYLAPPSVAARLPVDRQDLESDSEQDSSLTSTDAPPPFLLPPQYLVPGRPLPEGFRPPRELPAERQEAGPELRLSAFQEQARALYGGRYPQASPRGDIRTASFDNRDNGLWRLVVTAIDEVGNTGEYAEYYFRLNKFKPYTLVSSVVARQDESGELSLRIVGRGFRDAGVVTTVWLDRDGRAPYDREFLLETVGFTISSDREIAGIRAENMEEGQYRVGITHPERGVYWSRPLVRIDETGTVKFGDYTRRWEAEWKTTPSRRFRLDLSWLLALAFVAFAAVGLLVSVRGIASVMREGRIVQREVQALLTGEIMPREKKQRTRALKRQGLSLRWKLAGFTTLLAAMVVAMVSIPLSLRMIETQEETLINGLRDRALVLLESLAAGARAYLPSQNLLELGFLPAQTSAVPEVLHTTITGFGTGTTVFPDHVWATNDPDILAKIDTAEYQAGISRIEDALSPRLEAIANSLNERARSSVGELSTAISDLNREGISLALRNDAASRQRLQDIQDTTSVLESRLNEALSTLSAETGSEPAFPQGRLDRANDQYILYKPVLYRQGEGDIYFRGLVRITLSTASIGQELKAASEALVRITIFIALIALAIGILGAQILSAVIVSPVKKLARHVAIIRDTENKAELEGQDIRVSSKDEIATLGETINEMTHGLVKAALASQDLTIGKEVQKMFIPLDTDNQGRKLTSGLNDTPLARFFGYYEGAKGVSGDYFDYIRLEGDYYAIIKCDVAGKGVPAALIMVEVATLFLNFFKNWKPDRAGLKIETVVYQINDFIETRGFKGRFAAFTLCLFNAKTGVVRFCNAGDNLVHWFDASEGMMKKITLPETPTAGVFPNDLIEMKGGYQVQTITLDHGDSLLLYTDGIEEAKRRFRDAKLKEFVCAEGNAAIDTPHGSHAVGQADEELGYERVRDILNAMFNRREYILQKYHSPDPSEVLRFDFTRAKGDIQDAIMALVSVEKIFRMYKDPKASEDQRVLVDRKVDECLHEWFDQYRAYCAHHRDHPELPEYLYYTGIREDDQYDDLTILGITRK